MEPAVSFFKPQMASSREPEVVLLTLEELEAVRLSDREGLDQEEAAERMGISRRALWEDLRNARRKIVEALVEGKAIEIKGGHYTVEGRWRCECHDCHSEWETTSEARRPMECPHCGCREISRHLTNPDRTGSRCGCRRGCCKGERKRSEGAVQDSEKDVT